MIDQKVPVIGAALVGLPGYGITIVFIDWYYGLKHSGLVILLRIFRNQWFWFIPTFVTLAICVSFYAYKVKLSRDSRHLCMLLWEVSLVILFLVHCLHAYQLLDEVDVATLRSAPPDGRLHSSKRLFRKSVKEFCKKVGMAYLREISSYPLSAILFIGEREILAAFLFGIIPISTTVAALAMAASGRRKFMSNTDSSSSDDSSQPLMNSPMYTFYVNPTGLLFYVLSL